MVPATAPSSGRTIRRRHTETRRSRSSERPVAAVTSRLLALMFPPPCPRGRTHTGFPFEVDYGMDISRRKDDYARRPDETGERPTAMPPLRVGISGAGLISQDEHIPNLMHLPDLFEIVAVADPSPAARAFVAERWRLATHASLDGLLAERLDALLVASPDFAHVETVLRGFAAGLHVFCEK